MDVILLAEITALIPGLFELIVIISPNCPDALPESLMPLAVLLDPLLNLPFVRARDRASRSWRGGSSLRRVAYLRGASVHDTGSSLNKGLDNGFFEVRFTVFETGFNLSDDVWLEDGLLLEIVQDLCTSFQSMIRTAP